MATKHADALATLLGLGQELAEELDRRGLSYAEAAKEMGIAPSTLWRIRHGKDSRAFCLTAVLNWMITSKERV